jgi:hypothetical protein
LAILRGASPDLRQEASAWLPKLALWQADGGESGAPQTAETLGGTVILRSRRRRRISQRLENTQSEILGCAQDDSIEGFFRSLLGP